MKYFKKLISVVLALIMILSTFSINAFAADVSEEAATGSANVLNFDANTSGWNNYKKIFCHIWVYNGDSFYAWQSKAEACTDPDKDGIWTYDLDAKNISLDYSTLYCVIFSNENGMQTYDLLFDTSVIGDTAYCDGTFYENPEDSSKTAHAAFWRGQDPTAFGPVKCITSIGNVVGTCLPYTTTPQDMFEDFLLNKLENARTYSNKDDQKLIDDTAAALELTRNDVEHLIYITGVSVAWRSYNSSLESGVATEPKPTESYPDWDYPDYDDNASDDEIPIPEKPSDMDPPELPNYPMTSGDLLHFDANSAGWRNFSRVFCHLWTYGGDSFYAWQAKGERCTDTDGDGIWTYDLDEKGISLEYGTLYAVIFSNENGMQTYNLLLDSTVLGDTACCAGIRFEAPQDSSKTVQAAYWCNQDPTEFGPELLITSIGNVIGTCLPYTKTPQDMFEEFLHGDLSNARTYSGKSDQRILDDIAYMLDMDVQDVEEAIERANVYVNWSAKKSYLEGYSTYVESVPAVPKENLEYELNVMADTIWGSYADRIYCHIYSEDKGITFYAKGDKKEQCTKNDDGTWSYNLKDNNITLEDGITYNVMFYSTLPTVPSTPIMNINNTYLDYTLEYVFENSSYKWTYYGDMANICPSLPKLDKVADTDCIFIDARNYSNYEGIPYLYLVIEIDNQQVQIECKHMYNGIWKADLASHGINLEDDKYYRVQLAFNEPFEIGTYINGTYMGYTTDFVLDNWYYDDHKANFPRLDPLPSDADTSSIFIDIKDVSYEKYVDEVTLDIGLHNEKHTIIHCERIFGSVWKADLKKNNVVLKDGEYYDFYADYDYDHYAMWEDFGYAIDKAEPVNPYKTIDKSYLGYTYMMNKEADFHNRFEYVDQSVKYILGDVDRDDVVSVMDATEIQLVLAQMKPFVDDIAKANADFDGDGAISVMDATEIQLKLVGIK